MKTLLVLIVAIFSLGISSTAFAWDDSKISNNGDGLTTDDGRCTTCRSHTLPHLRVLDKTLLHSGGVPSANGEQPTGSKGNGAVD